MPSARLIALLFAALHFGVLAWAQEEAAPAILPADSGQPEMAATRPDTNPSPIPAPEPPKMLSPMRRGDILMARKRYREAIETYQEGIRSAAILSISSLWVSFMPIGDFRSDLPSDASRKRKLRQVVALQNARTVHAFRSSAVRRA